MLEIDGVENPLAKTACILMEKEKEIVELFFSGKKLTECKKDLEAKLRDVGDICFYEIKYYQTFEDEIDHEYSARIKGSVQVELNKIVAFELFVTFGSIYINVIDRHDFNDKDQQIILRRHL